MTTFIIEQYEIHAQTYHVEANTKAEAIAQVMNGNAEPIDNGLDYIGVLDDWGMDPEDDDLANELDLGVSKIIPSIRSIQEV